MSDIFISYHRFRCDQSTFDRIFPALRTASGGQPPQVDTLTDAELCTLADGLGISQAELMSHRWLVRSLKKQGWSVWWDQDILAGTKWPDRIADELGSARCVIVLCTAQSLENMWVINEGTVAQCSGKLIPLLLGATAPEFWKNIQYLNITNWKGSTDEDVYKKIVEAITEKIGPPPGTESDDERFVAELVTAPGEPWTDKLVKYIADKADKRDSSGTAKPCQQGKEAIIALLSTVTAKKTSYSTDDPALALLTEIEYWLRDEKIVVTGADHDDGDDLPHPALVIDADTHNSRSQLPVGIWSKTDWSDRRKPDNRNPSRLTSLVAQCMFMVAEPDHQVYFALHDRSYTGAEDARSHYALVTGRLSWEDMEFKRTAQLDDVRESCLKRELQEIDELNLDSEEARKFVADAKFIGVFPNKDNSIRSFLHVIEITPDQFDKINRRGPYLFRATPEQYARLHFLGLLGAILKTNSCPNCDTQRATAAMTMTSPDRCLGPERPCIIQEVLRHRHEHDAATTLATVTNKTRKPNNAVILLADIVDFRNLSERSRRDLMLQLNGYLSGWLPKVPSGLGSRVNCAEGRLRIVFWRKNNAADDAPKDALVAYFLALYLSLKLEDLAGFMTWNAPGCKPSPIRLRIGLHADVLTASDADPAEIQPGDGLLIARDILDLCRDRQILVSENYLLRLVGELKRIGEQDESEKWMLQASESDPLLLRVINLRRQSDPKSGLWNQVSLRQCLESLRLPPDMVKSLDCDWLNRTGLEDDGIVVGDIGYLTGRGNVRHRVFNLWGKIRSGDVPGYGEARPPLTRPTLLPRDAVSTKDELARLIASIDKVRHLTVYGYSNVRLLDELSRKLDQDQDFKASFRKHLESLRIIFYDYQQIAHINEKKSSYLARMDWIKGFLLAITIKEKIKIAAAQEIPDECPEKTSVLVNHVRYGFNVLKAIYSSEAEAEHLDQIRLTVPIPGRSFELAPVFALYRGDPWFHEYLDICERYLEQGRMENDKRITVAEYELAPGVAAERNEWIEHWTRNPQPAQDDEKACLTLVASMLRSGPNEKAPDNADFVIQRAAADYCQMLSGSSFEVERVRELWCLRKVIELSIANSDGVGDPICPAFIAPA